MPPRTRSSSALFALVAVACLVVLGCADDQDGGGGTTTSTASSGPAQAAANTTANATSASVVASGTTTTASGASSAGSGSGGGTLIECASFDDGSVPASWSVGAQDGGMVEVSTDPSGTFGGTGASLRGAYPTASGGVYVWATYDLAALGTRDLYVDLRARMPATKQGLKFVKVFGASNGDGYANTTFGLDYTGGDPGAMYQVSFGDGSTTGNDTANVINFDGTYPEWIGRSFGTATVTTPQAQAWGGDQWGDDWHHFRLHVAFNEGTSSANEIADGAYFVEVDGVVYVDATGLLNRHPSNGPIERVELFGWSQNGDAPFEIWYDDVCLSTGGFL